MRDFGIPPDRPAACLNTCFRREEPDSRDNGKFPRPPAPIRLPVRREPQKHFLPSTIGFAGADGRHGQQFSPRLFGGFFFRQFLGLLYVTPAGRGSTAPPAINGGQQTRPPSHTVHFVFMASRPSPPGTGIVGTTYVGRKIRQGRARSLRRRREPCGQVSARSFTDTLEISTANCRRRPWCEVWRTGAVLPACRGEPLKRFRQFLLHQFAEACGSGSENGVLRARSQGIRPVMLLGVGLFGFDVDANRAGQSGGSDMQGDEDGAALRRWRAARAVVERRIVITFAGQDHPGRPCASSALFVAVANCNTSSLSLIAFGAACRRGSVPPAGARGSRTTIFNPERPAGAVGVLDDLLR